MLPYPYGFPYGFPYGVTQISSQPIVNSPVLPSDLTDINNQIQSARVINPLTMDYELNANGTFTGQSVVQTSVYLALFTQLNSSAVFGMGQNISSIKVITPNITTQVANQVNLALTSLINQGLVVLLNVSVSNPAQGELTVQVQWQDLTVNSANQPIQTTNVLISAV